MTKTSLISIITFCAIILAAFVYYQKIVYKSTHITSSEKTQLEKLTPLDEIKEGDLIFQESQSGQSKAIQLATHSKYSHCGIIYRDTSGFNVYEAVQPVKFTPLDEWIVRGKNRHYVIKRLKDARELLTPEALKKMKQVGNKFAGKNYDLYFEWSDDRFYCSELIYKIYERGAGIKIGVLQKLKDFDLSSPEVKQKLQERYGNKIPLEDSVVSPTSIFDSDQLITIKSSE